MIRRAPLAFAILALGATLAFADPAARVDYPGGTPRVRLDGDWSGSRYTISRAPGAAGPFTSLTDGDVLCTGECFALDRSASLGSTYWYEFELTLADGSSRRYGPYALTLAPELARGIRLAVTPVPARGAVTLELGLAGARDAAPVAAEARVYDAGGRRVATAFRGTLLAGTTRLAWTPRDDSGRALATGWYLLSLRAADGRRAVTKLVVAR